MDLLGSLIHGTEDWEGKNITTYQIVSDLILQKKIPANISDMITHRFKISDYKNAIKVAFSKRKNNAIKVVFDYEN